MTWEEKLFALQAIADTCLRMRQPGDWYVESEGRGICGDGFEIGSYGNGSTPQEDDWRQVLDDLPPGKYLRVSKPPYGPENTRYLRWVGFMWKDVPG